MNEALLGWLEKSSLRWMQLGFARRTLFKRDVASYLTSVQIYASLSK